MLRSNHRTSKWELTNNSIISLWLNSILALQEVCHMLGALLNKRPYQNWITEWYRIKCSGSSTTIKLKWIDEIRLPLSSKCRIEQSARSRVLWSIRHSWTLPAHLVKMRIMLIRRNKWSKHIIDYQKSYLQWCHQQAICNRKWINIKR